MAEDNIYFTWEIPFTEWGMDMTVWFLVGITVGMTLTLGTIEIARRKAIRQQEKANSEAWLKHIRNGGTR